VVSIGTHGLTASVLHEIDVNLTAHELIKVRVFNDEREERERVLARICADLDAAPVQHLGKILTLWRPTPAPEAKPVAATKKKVTAPSGSRSRAGENPRRRLGTAGKSRRQA